MKAARAQTLWGQGLSVGGGGQAAELTAGRGRAALHCRNDSIASVLAGVRADQATSPE